MSEADPAPAPTAAPAPAPAPTPAPSPTPTPTNPITGGTATPAATGDHPEWMVGLSEELRGDATLAKYGSLDDFAKGHLETKRVASSKAVPLPGETEESRKAFADALRQESIDAYDFGDVPETMDKDLVEGFRQFSFEQALPPHMAQAALNFYTEAMAKQVEKANADSATDVEKFKTEYGPQYDAKIKAVQQMLESFTGTPMELSEADLNRMDLKLGSSTLLKAMFAIHDRVGDLTPAGEHPVPTGITPIAPENAEAAWNAKKADPEWRKKVKIEGSPEARENAYLQKLIAQHRVSQERG